MTQSGLAWTSESRGAARFLPPHHHILAELQHQPPISNPSETACVIAKIFCPRPQTAYFGPVRQVLISLTSCNFFLSYLIMCSKSIGSRATGCCCLFPFISGSLLDSCSSCCYHILFEHISAICCYRILQSGPGLFSLTGTSPSFRTRSRESARDH